MCDALICIQIGCSNNYSQEGDGKAHVCPRCHNAAVSAVKEQRCLEICCIQVFPIGSSHIWQCSICQWTASQNGPAPPVAMAGPLQPQSNQGYPGQPGMYTQPQQPGYNV